MLDQKLVVIRGGGDIASGIASRLYNSGFQVIILEIEKPSVIRRTVSFAQAIYENQVVVQGICGKLVKSMEEALVAKKSNFIPVLIDETAHCLKDLSNFVLVDAILAKKNLGTFLESAPVVIGVGPGFTVGIDVHAVIETKRGHHLGEMILQGSAQEDTGIPGVIGGYGIERVIKSPKEGQLKIVKDIGSVVESGDIVAFVDEIEVKTQISGVVRGMIQEGYGVTKNMKIADVDPRGNVAHCFSVSDKARAIGGGVLEAILYYTNK